MFAGETADSEDSIALVIDEFLIFNGSMVCLYPAITFATKSAAQRNVHRNAFFTKFLQKISVNCHLKTARVLLFGKAKFILETIIFGYKKAAQPGSTSSYQRLKNSCHGPNIDRSAT